MLISEEEIPFKDDPRDETYKPHLERHVSGLLVENVRKAFLLFFHLVAKLVDMDLIFKGVAPRCRQAWHHPVAPCHSALPSAGLCLAHIQIIMTSACFKMS